MVGIIKKLILFSLLFINSNALYAGGFFETGRVTVNDTVDNGGWVNVVITKPFVNPVVVAGPITHNNDLALFVRVRNVTAAGFQIGMQSPCESYSPVAGVVCPPVAGWDREEVNYWVMEEGVWEFPDGQEVEAFVHNTNALRAGLGPDTFDVIDLMHTYATSNVVVHNSVMSFNDPDFIYSVATLGTSVGLPPAPTAADNDFALMLEGMEFTLAHGAEDIAWIAMEPSSGTNSGFSYDNGRTAEDVDRHSDGCYARGPAGLTTENIISSANTMNGGNGAGVRFCTGAGAAVGRMNVHVDEDQVNDIERTGIPESVTWFTYDDGGFGALDFITATLTVVDENAGTVLPGDFLTYSVNITNRLDDFAQADNASNELEILLDSNVTFDSVTSVPSGALVHNAGTMEWDGAIPASGSVLMLYRVQVNDDVCGAGGTISSQGTLFMDPNGDGDNAIEEVTDDPTADIGGDTDWDILTNDDDPTEIRIDCTVDLQIRKSDALTTYTPGGTATYTIQVRNTGPASVNGATIADDLPDGVTMTAPWTCTPSSANSTCNTAPSTTDPISIDVDIAVGDSITVTVPVQFSSNMGDY